MIKYYVLTPASNSCLALAALTFGNSMRACSSGLAEYWRRFGNDANSS
jgi:hypothetical protein